MKPRGLKENLLWVGWFIVVSGWLALPFLAGRGIWGRCAELAPSLCNPFISWVGIMLVGAGYAGTLWCYAAMGDTWRMGINRNEKTTLVTRGPYRYVRHPIYVFQVVMLAGVALLLPTPLALMILGVHLLCILAKAADEESYLRTSQGTDYSDYLSRTGRFFPKLSSRKSQSG